MSTRSNRDHNQGNHSYIAPIAGKRGLTTRSRNVHDQNYDPAAIKPTNNKRKADDSPLKNNKTSKIKRSALGNLTNATVIYVPDGQPTKNVSKKTVLSNVNNANQPKTSANHNGPNNGSGILLPPTMVPRSTKILTRAAMKNSALAAIHSNIPSDVAKSNAHKKVIARGPLHEAETVVKRESQVTVAKPTTRRISNEFQSDDSMYMSALEDISENDSNKICSSSVSNTTLVGSNEKELNRIESPDLSIHVVPSNVIDFDKENWDDPFQVSHYALDIFGYLKEREEHFLISDYIGRQTSLTKWMRSLLVDWMVEVQESFELNHETLYLAVKIVDLYLSKETISKDSLQLLGAAALFLSSKYEENNPPLTEDFLYICDGAYTDKQLIRMEKLVFRTINFNLGIPLSYRFLRRYARAGKIPMSTLTLARYILELSLMDYATIQFRDSKSAAAALFIALRMNDEPGWNDTLEFYSGYKIDDFANIVFAFNVIVARKPKDPINTIRKKYSHSVFLAVAKVPLKSNAELFVDYSHLLKMAPGGKSAAESTK